MTVSSILQHPPSVLLRILFSSEGEAVFKLKKVQSVYLVEPVYLLVCQKIKVSLQQLSIGDVHLLGRPSSNFPRQNTNGPQNMVSLQVWTRVSPPPFMDSSRFFLREIKLRSSLLEFIHLDSKISKNNKITSECL